MTVSLQLKKDGYQCYQLLYLRTTLLVEMVDKGYDVLRVCSIADLIPTFEYFVPFWMKFLDPQLVTSQKAISVLF